MSTSTRNTTDRKNRHSQAGFNLIEVMVALGILAFGILAVASMQDSSLRGTSRAYNLTDGTTVAMDEMERLMGLQYSNAELNITEEKELPSQGRFTPLLTVTQAGINTKMVTVEVTWTEAGGAEKSTSLTSIKNRL